MRQTLGPLVVCLGLVINAPVWVAAQSGAGASTLEGAWAVQDVTYAKPPAIPENKPAGQVQFHGRHYSMVILHDSARPNFGQGGEASGSADQLRAIWGPLQANAGTFTVTGNTIRLTRNVAKNPDVMAAGNFGEHSFTLTGETLVMTETRTNAGPVANPRTMRLRRVK
jgi:hypothetical protein